MNNVVCGDGTSWTTNLYDGIVNAFVVQTIVNPSDSNLYVLDSNMDLVVFNGQTWTTIISDVLFIAPWENRLVELLPVSSKECTLLQICNLLDRLTIILGGVCGALLFIAVVLSIVTSRRRKRNDYIMIPTDFRESDEKIEKKIQSSCDFNFN